MKPETLLVDRLRPGGFIREEFPVEGSLQKILSYHRHRASVCLKEEIPALCGAVLTRKFQCEYSIWNDSEFHSLVEVHPPAKRLTLGSEVLLSEEPSAGEP